MEKQTSIKLKIVSLVISMLVCFFLIGISVWAAMSQNLSINNNISITTSGQTKVAVSVYEYIHTGEDAVGSAPTDVVDWGDAKVSKTAEENTKSGSVTKIDFSANDNKNYYAYKFTFTNESDIAVYAHITASAVNNAQITVYYGETWGSSMTALNNQALDADVTLQASPDGSGEFYIAVVSNTALGNLTGIEGTLEFNMNILLDQVAPI